MKSESFKSVFAKAIMSGIMIGIGGTVYLNVDNKYLGAFLFSFGLFTIIRYGFALYTGKVGYIPERKPRYILEVLETFLGNSVGTAIAACFVRLSRIGDHVAQNAAASMAAKTGDSLPSQIVLGFFCGLLMYLAVENGRKCKETGSDTSLVFGTVMPIMVFILCGFNHSVADCFYMMVSGTTVSGCLYIGVIIISNALGGMLVPVMKKFFDKEKAN